MKIFKRSKWVSALALAALGGLIGAQAWAQTPPPSQPQAPSQRPVQQTPNQRPVKRGNVRPVVGTISFVSGNSFVVTTWSNRTVTVETTASTRVLTQQQGALSDLRSGDFVRITATKSANNALVADRLSDTPAAIVAQSAANGRDRSDSRTGLWSGRGSTVNVSGTLTAAPSNGGVTVALPAGQPLTVSVPSTARISRTVSLPVSGLTVGIHVAVSGTPAASGSGLTATMIYVPGTEQH
jgi:hypothetical protein